MITVSLFVGTLQIVTYQGMGLRWQTLNRSVILLEFF